MIIKSISIKDVLFILSNR